MNVSLSFKCFIMIHTCVFVCMRNAHLNIKKKLINVPLSALIILARVNYCQYAYEY